MKNSNCFNRLVSLCLCLLLLTNGACKKEETGNNNVSTDITADDIALPKPFEPQSPDILAPYVGVWEGSSLKVVYLLNGRAAIYNRYSSKTPLEVGTYHVNDNKSMDFDWVFSG
jgi:hypothetical protein